MHGLVEAVAPVVLAVLASLVEVVKEISAEGEAEVLHVVADLEGLEAIISRRLRTAVSTVEVDLFTKRCGVRLEDHSVKVPRVPPET